MKDLFGKDVTARQWLLTNRKPRISERAHKLMMQVFGKKADKKCKECKHFYYRVFSKKYPKCALSGCNGASASSDWSGKWQACGKFEENKDTKTI